MNELHTNSALKNGIVRALGLDDGEAGVGNVAHEVQTVFDPWRMPEHALLRGDLLLWGYDSQAGGVATRAICQLINESSDDNPYLLVIEPGTLFGAVNSVATENCYLAMSSTVLATDNGLLRVRDTRSVVLSPYVRRRAQALAIPASISTGIAFVFHAAALGPVNTWLLRFPIVIKPGGALHVFLGTDNTNIYVSWVARARRMLPGEYVRG